MKCNAYHIFFRNLANPLKIEIITALREKPMSVNELVEKLKIEQSKLSHALANLRFCNLVTTKQKGKQRIYSLNKKTIIPILNIIDKHRVNFCPGCKK
ncbi:winged helix-turn-helix transcriptional regulator [archaeon]|jgi:DNA-binding transcriptional ArsR family regulator|nr:winged helix-turn-helix transcriptional regulator [archaeon]